MTLKEVIGKAYRTIQFRLKLFVKVNFFNEVHSRSVSLEKDTKEEKEEKEEMLNPSVLSYKTLVKVCS
jgi:hypothetical protein